MKTFVTIIILLATCSMGVAQAQPEQFIDKFFSDYENDGPINALDNLYSTMPWADRIPDDIAQLKTQFSGLQAVVGDYYGYGLIAEKELAGSFSIHSYLVKFDRQPVRFIFQFYKPKDTWGLYSFSYDDDIGEELEEAIKLYFLDINE